MAPYNPIIYGPQWDPNYITGLLKWFDPTQYVDNGGSPLRLNTWTNQGNTGADASGAGGQPYVELNSINGYASMRTTGAPALIRVTFDGTTQYIDKDLPFSMFWVFKGETWTADAQYYSMIQMNAGASEPLWGVYYINPTGGLANYPRIGVFNSQGGKKVFGSGFTGYNTYHAVCITYNGAGDLNVPANYNIYVNGGLEAMVDNNTLQGGTSLNGTNTLRSADGFNTATDHRWVEFGLCDEELDALTVGRLMAYFNMKYDLY